MSTQEPQDRLGDDFFASRLAERVQAHRDRKAARQADRDAFAQRRAHGLQARKTNKLRRTTMTDLTTIGHQLKELRSDFDELKATTLAHHRHMAALYGPGSAERAAELREEIMRRVQANGGSAVIQVSMDDHGLITVVPD